MTSYYGTKLLASIVISLVLNLQGTLGGIVCEDLTRDTCAFSVSSSGTRCVLEKHVQRGKDQYTCRSSEIEAEKLTDWIENDQCIQACGLNRDSVGISSDSLMESQFTAKLCSPRCYQGCPNVVDLYFNLAAGEGVFLPKLCEAQRTSARRGMAEIRSSGVVASAPQASLPEILATLAPAPF